MGNAGKITELEPQDGLGWIVLDTDGSRIRFGATACKGFVPAVGMQVSVLGTKPGFRGTVKATGVELISEGAGEATESDAAAPRKALVHWKSLGVRGDELLESVIGRSDFDEAFYRDLVSMGFEVSPSAGSAINCKNPWFYVVAMNGGGSAYGVYAHPGIAADSSAPWVFWNHEDDTIRYLTPSASLFFSGLLNDAAGFVTDQAIIEGSRRALVSMGMNETIDFGVGKGVSAPWLPPEDSELRTLDEYLSESDGGEMERGLLAYASRRKDARAQEALKSLYASWGWPLSKIWG